MLNSFRNFAYVSNYLHLKSFAWKRDCPISSKPHHHEFFTKVIQGSSYSLLKVTSKQKTLKQPVYFLKAVEFCTTFDIQSGITLARFGETLQNHTFQKTHGSLSKHAKIHINRATSQEITALQKYEKFVFLLAAPFLKKKITDIWNF